MHPSWPACPRGSGDRKCEPVLALRPSGDDGQAGLSSFELYLARHGETAWSLSGQHTGITDLPLTSRGEDNARELGRRLRGIDFDVVYSSPMQRATRTAQLAGFTNPQITDLLKEVDYGRYEGLTSEQIHSENPDWELYADGCPGGETLEHIYKRANEFIELATSRHEGRVLAFSHGHILRAIAVAWIEVAIIVAARLQLDVASVSNLRDAGRGRVIALWNAT